VVVTEEQLRSTLRAMWHRTVRRCSPCHDGALWQVRTAPSDVLDEPADLVAKWVPAHRGERLTGGLGVAEHLDDLGLDAGAPLIAVDGCTSVPLHSGMLALLRRAPGRPLDPADPVDQQFWGDMLGRVHRALIGYHHPRLTRPGPLDPTAAHLALQPWLRPAVAAAATALRRLTLADQLSYGVLHGDPDPAAFRIDRDTGRVGLVGWGWASTGPLLFDVAVAVGYVGGIPAAGEFLEGYRAAGPLRPGELEAGLPTVLRSCWARRADGLARRLHTGTSPDPAADLAGLAQAQQALSTAAST
jgi:Ser/Thr protein kinase RdoA (MazF antagonist)